MKLTRIILLASLSVAASWIKSDGQPPRPFAEQLKLASVTPRGAMLYLQTSDLSALMKRWLASQVRDQFYKSASFTAYSRSRLYLKLAERRKDFENAIGFGLDENRLAEIAGGASAVAVYDIGNLELVLVTEVARARAVTTALFKRAPQFSERQAGDNLYYVRDVATDGGRLNQQFCFAHVDDKLIITTTEGLMIRAMANARSAGSDSLLTDVTTMAEHCTGFAVHDVTMWLDQARLNRNRHFNSYWIHENVRETAPSGLSRIETGLIDLRFTRDGFAEQRWFRVGDRAPGEGEKMSAESASRLLGFAPADAHLIELHPGVSQQELGGAVSRALFGEMRADSWSASEAPDRTRPRRDGETAGGERYRYLDSRFDVDVDDEQAPSRGVGAPGRGSEAKVTRLSPTSDFPAKITAALASASPSGYNEIVRSLSETNKPFVRFERALAIEMKSASLLARTQLERAIVDELRARFVVGGAASSLEWQDAGVVRYIAQSLTDRGVAYAVVGNHLVLASSRELAADILRAAAAPARASGIDAPVEFYAVVRVAEARTGFDKLMSKLDGRTGTAVAPGENAEVKFFSENLSSLIAALALREFRVTRESNDSMLVERIVYRQ